VLPLLRPIAFLLTLGVSTGAFAADLTITAKFQCNLGKTIEAVFSGSEVHLTLSDGRTMILPQVISGSGARYANADESFVFWNKGNTAFITEGGDDKQTYSDCVTETK